MGHQSSKVSDVSTLQIADHICVWDISLKPIRYQHHGLVRKTGKSPNDIIIAHIWSPIQNDRFAAQRDARWRETTLTEFLFNRPLKSLRVVQYYVSFLGDLQMKLGEAHISTCDIPSVVTTRSDWLLGQGTGKFHIFFQNCEHAAYWCKTGRLWSKQILSLTNRAVPFPCSKEDENKLFQEINEAISQYKKIREISAPEIVLPANEAVYLKVDQKYVMRGKGRQLFVSDIVDDCKSVSHLAAFHIVQRTICYNVTHLSFKCAITGEFLFSPTLWQMGRHISLRHQSSSGMFGSRNGCRFLHHDNGEMQTLHHDRNWVCVSDDHRLVLRSDRAKAAQFVFVPVNTADVIEDVLAHGTRSKFGACLDSILKKEKGFSYVNLRNRLSEIVGRSLTREERRVVSSKLKNKSKDNRANHDINTTTTNVRVTTVLEFEGMTDKRDVSNNR